MKIVILSIIIACVSFPLHAQERQGTTEQIKLMIDTPHSGYSVEIKSVYTTPDETFVLAILHKPDPDRNFMAVIETITDTVTVNKVSGKVTFFVIGKDWNWENEGNFNFILNEEQFLKIVEDAQEVEILD